MNRASGTLGKMSETLTYMYLESQKEKGEQVGQKNIWINNSWKISKFGRGEEIPNLETDKPYVRWRQENHT